MRPLEYCCRFLSWPLSNSLMFLHSRAKACCLLNLGSGTWLSIETQCMEVFFIHSVIVCMVDFSWASKQRVCRLLSQTGDHSQQHCRQNLGLSMSVAQLHNLWTISFPARTSAVISFCRCERYVRNLGNV